jgi:predicted ATPase
MLTRLEVDGFKNLLDFAVDFGPYNCIAGPNGVGKSNLFDVIQFLSLLADRPIVEAALSVRGADPETADLRELFWTDGQRRLDSFRLAAEMIVEPEVVDDFGRTDRARSTYLRYELAIGYEEPNERGTLGRLVLQSETLDYITEGEAAGRLRFPHSVKLFRRSIVDNRRRAQSGYISTVRAPDGRVEILVHQEGHAGSPQRAPAATAPRTAVATVNTTANPTILAVRREMQRWHLLSLEPSSMRRTDRFASEPQVSSSGEHLAATLYRLGREAVQQGDTADQVYSRVASRLSSLVGISDLRVRLDEVRQLLILEASEESGVPLPARSLSDGTLRFLTLSVLAEDPSARGVICMEEPENGIHPAKMDAMVRLLRDLAVDPQVAPGRLNPLRQVVVATHSPIFVQLQDRNDLLAASEVQLAGPGGRPTPTLRCRPLTDSWRARDGADAVSEASILAYLTAPPGAQLGLPLERMRSTA